MDHLAKDLSVALEESESCGPITFTHETHNKWGMRRRTRSAGNLLVYLNNSPENHGDETTSSNSETRNDKTSSHSRITSFHQSDSDEVSFNMAIATAMHNKNPLRMRHALHNYVRGRCKKLWVNHSLESDSVNENSPARPNLRRKRKLKRMSIDEVPIPPSGKRKRSQRLDIVDSSARHTTRIRPLHQTLVDKIEKMFQSGSSLEDGAKMETQSIEDCEFTSESSISWSGGEGHDGDDELTDWAPSMDNSSTMDQPSFNDADPREIRAGCRRLGDERPGFSISTGANERVAKFLQDTSKSELRLFGAERDKLGQLAALYSLDLWFDSPTSSLLRKTDKTPCMQPPQKHHGGMNAGHKRIRTHGRFLGIE